MTLTSVFMRFRWVCTTASKTQTLMCKYSAKTEDDKVLIITVLWYMRGELKSVLRCSEQSRVGTCRRSLQILVHRSEGLRLCAETLERYPQVCDIKIYKNLQPCNFDKLHIDAECGRVLLGGQIWVVIVSRISHIYSSVGYWGRDCLCVIDTARRTERAGAAQSAVNRQIWRYKYKNVFSWEILKYTFNGSYLFINSCWLLSRPNCFEKFDMKRTLAEWFLEHILAKINSRFMPVWVFKTTSIYRWMGLSWF